MQDVELALDLRLTPADVRALPLIDYARLLVVMGSRAEGRRMAYEKASRK